MLRAPELDAGLPVGSHQSRVEGQNPLPHTAGDAAQDSVAFWAANTHCQVMLCFSTTSTPKSTATTSQK